MNKKRVLIDTNILIYISNRDEKYSKFLESLDNSELYLSVISYIEFTIYPEADRKIIEYMSIVNLDKQISDRATEVLRKTNRKTTRNPKFSDIIIGATAEVLGIPLITNNPKDFAIFKNLEIIVIK